MPRKINRAAAKARGLSRYFTGKLCARGHRCERFTLTANCVECKRLSDARYQRSPKGREAQREAQRRYSQTPLGRERTWRYNQSWKRQEARQRYEDSPKGQNTRADYQAARSGLPSTEELLARSRMTPLRIERRRRDVRSAELAASRRANRPAR